MVNIRKMFASNAPSAVLLPRIVVGAVFVSEGIQKFINPGEVGAGRFEKIGIPAPDFSAGFVGGVEMICGALILLGLATRAAAIPLIVIMLVAISTTKIPILLAKGFWSMAHDSRTDFAMLLTSTFLLIVGSGPLSLDAKMPRQAYDKEEKP